MEDFICKLAEIEATASHIMDDVSEQKKQLSREYEEAIAKFDQNIDSEMKKRSDKICSELEVKMKTELDKQEAQTAMALDKMETYYNDCHTELAKQIYDRILRM